jgi:hypothetical protein
MTKSYLLGALHDGTVRRVTYRIGAKDLVYVEFLKAGILQLGYKAWLYKEGKDRNYFIVEFSKSVLRDIKILSPQDKINYIRGYFDTDGGVARSQSVRYYIYFAQKNKNDLITLKRYLEELYIQTGVIHNPSRKKDSNYWRFFIKANSYKKFATLIGSWHPIKSKFLRVMI